MTLGSLRRALFLLVIGLAVLLGSAVPASAHAGLIAATPTPGSVIGRAPTEIIITFSEPVTPVAGHVQVLAPDGQRIAGPATVRGAVLRIPVRRAGRPLGSYLVSWRVISADSHPVGGAMTFAIGAPSATPRAPADGDDQTRTVAAGLSRVLSYLGLVVAVGPAMFLGLLWPRRRPRRAASRLAYAGLGLVAVATVGALWVQAANATGTSALTVSTRAWSTVLTSPYGFVLLGRLALLAGVAALLPPVLAGTANRTRALSVAAVGGAVLTTWPLTGHAVVAPLAPIVVAADVVHLAAMAVWLGGLVTLTAFLLPRTAPRVLAVILPVWSRWAALSVVWLIGAGAVQAVVQIGTFSALWRTPYGVVLLAKLAVVTVTLAIAGLARRIVRRAQVPARGAGRLRVTVGIEVAATVVILGLSAVLVQSNPGRDDTVAAGPARAAGVSQTLTSPLYTLQFSVYPVQLGDANTIHAFLYTPAGAPLPADQWSVSTRLRGHDLEPVTEPMLGIIPRNHAVGAITFPLPGTYDVAFTIRVGELDEATVHTSITVGGARTGS